MANLELCKANQDFEGNSLCAFLQGCAALSQIKSDIKVNRGKKPDQMIQPDNMQRYVDKIRAWGCVNPDEVQAELDEYIANP